MCILLLFGLVGSALSMSQLQITNHWNGGFEGDFTVTGEAHGWKAHLVFDHPVNKIEVNNLLFKLCCRGALNSVVLQVYVGWCSKE